MLILPNEKKEEILVRSVKELLFTSLACNSSLMSLLVRHPQLKKHWIRKLATSNYYHSSSLQAIRKAQLQMGTTCRIWFTRFGGAVLSHAVLTSSACSDPCECHVWGGVTSTGNPSNNVHDCYSISSNIIHCTTQSWDQPGHPKYSPIASYQDLYTPLICRL